MKSAGVGRHSISLLWRAARNGHAQCINVLINQGVDVNERLKGEGTPISAGSHTKEARSV